MWVLVYADMLSIGGEPVCIVCWFH